MSRSQLALKGERGQGAQKSLAQEGPSVSRAREPESFTGPGVELGPRNGPKAGEGHNWRLDRPRSRARAQRGGQRLGVITRDRAKTGAGGLRRDACQQE